MKKRDHQTKKSGKTNNRAKTRIEKCEKKDREQGEMKEKQKFRHYMWRQAGGERER